MGKIIDQLKQLGFSQYEAQGYITLLERNPLNGYELAKASGIPRANIYGVLHKLEEQGAVVRLDTPEGTRYVPIASEELIQKLRTHFQDTLEAARTSLSEIDKQVEYEQVCNLHGYQVLLDYARVFIERTEQQLLLAVWPEEAKLLQDSLQRAEERGIDVTTLCMAGCPQECGSCRGRIHRYSVSPSQTRWLVLVPDNSEVLAGEIKSDEEALAVRTHQNLLVDLATWYIRNSIALAAVITDLGAELDHLLTPETRKILVSLGPGDAEGGWLEHMRQLLKLQEDKTLSNI